MMTINRCEGKGEREYETTQKSGNRKIFKNKGDANNNNYNYNYNNSSELNHSEYNY